MKFNVSGMGCSACSAKVEKATAAVEGVESVAVSLLTNSMQVEGNFDAAAVCAAVKAVGFGCEEAAPSK